VQVVDGPAAKSSTVIAMPGLEHPGAVECPVRHPKFPPVRRFFKDPSPPPNNKKQ
jgi:hypothetical protein